MHEVYSYEGHSIDLDFRELQPGRMQCTYFIDAAYCFESPETNSLDKARQGAIAQAHASIDALNVLKQRFPAASAGALQSSVGAVKVTEYGGQRGSRGSRGGDLRP